MAAIAAATTPYTAAALVALVAALTAGGSDTVASEIGKAWGRSTFLVTTFSRVTPGTPGAMSLEGTAAGLLAAFALAATGAALGLIPHRRHRRSSSSAPRPARWSRARLARRSKDRVS